ncbi:MCE family protein [Nocardioides pocheonensis]|uniref:MCE family protein n=1 Tax=Nocardioides pocheonensis TaxID=661485 RepID=A0A3N0GUM9_9ACTN|nr:MCE family protein [Nocardioides pocheonensis]RNM16111.1 MCE family protein [Nocardioides pocheonensis]
MKALGARDPFRIGLVAIAGGLVVGLLVVLVTFVPFGARSYTAVLAQTAGLRVGEDVEVYGVPKGEVKSIRLDGDTVLVRFVVDKGIDLGDRTTAAVKVATLLGTHYLAVTPAGSGQLERIPLSRTSVPFNLQDVLEKGTAKLEQLDPELLAKALTEASRTLSASSDQIGPALTGIARLSELVQSRSDQTGALLAAARQVTGQLAASSTDVVGLMKQANLVIDEITRRRAAIHTLLTETTTLSDNLAGIVQQTNDDMGPALRQLNAVLGTLRDEDAVLKDVLDKIAPTVRYFANATGNGAWGDLWLKDPALPPDDVTCRLGAC